MVLALKLVIDFRNSNYFADVTLACAEGHQVEAHKVILGAASPFFQQFTEKKQSY